MMGCWQNDPDARQTFTELKNELKDMGTLVLIILVDRYQLPHNDGMLAE